MIKANVKREMTNANIIIEEGLKKIRMAECANSFVDEIFKVCELAIDNATTEYNVEIAFPYSDWNFNDNYTRQEAMDIVMTAVEMVANKIAEYGYSCQTVRYTSRNTFKAGCIIISW